MFFFASWCSRCATQQERWRRWSTTTATSSTFVGVGGQDKAPAVKSWLDAHDVTYPVGIDGGLEIWRRYAVRQPPAVVLIAPGGKLERGWPGGVSDDVLAGELERLVQR